MAIKTTKYFQPVRHGRGNLGVAYATGDLKHLDLQNLGRVADWQPYTLELKGGEFGDYLANNIGVRICSTRLKEILDHHASAKDELQWLEVVLYQGEKKQPYWILHFPNPVDVLSTEKTIYAGDTKVVVKPVLSSKLADGQCPFGKRA